MKKVICCFIILLILAGGTYVSSANESFDKAKDLYKMGMISGTGNTNSQESFELERYATRAEMCIMVVRILGKEEKSNYQKNEHPFTDVPSWADNSIGWLYENYIVSGVSDTYFGASDVATVQQYSAMLLRVLGFSEQKGDFIYNNASNFALRYGIISSDMLHKYELSRGDMVLMTHNALQLKIKNSNRTLIKKLCDEGVVEENVAKDLGILRNISISEHFLTIPENLEKITVETQSNSFKIKFKRPVEEYGLRVFVKEDGGLIKEITYYTKSAYLQKGRISYPGDGAGYLDTLTIKGLDTRKQYEFIVLKTSSESDLYLVFGKSNVAVN